MSRFLLAAFWASSCAMSASRRAVGPDGRRFVLEHNCRRLRAAACDERLATNPIARYRSSRHPRDHTKQGGTATRDPV
jgi:hypothetical protein